VLPLDPHTGGAVDAGAERQPEGVYVVRLTVGRRTLMRRVIVVR
jgi:hypothetical protein